MRGVLKLTIVVAALLLAAGMAACGGGGDSGSTTTDAASQGERGAGASGNGASTAKKGKKGKSGSGEGDGKKNGQEGSGKKASDFVPKQHSDSGGGSQQFRVKGGDNSVQEFGKEAGTSERDAAATAVHNFLDARAEGNWAAACEYMSKSIVESLEKLAGQSESLKEADCATLLGKLTNKSVLPLLRKEAARADVGSLRVEGDRSFVIYKGLEGTIMAMPMADEGGTWKVASLASTPLN